MPPLIFRRGLELKSEVAGALSNDYDSDIVKRLMASDYCLQTGRLTLHLAREFGFCYGVDRAVDYAYQTRKRFPDRPVYLTGEIIHNPHVNQKLRTAGVKFLSDQETHSQNLGSNDVVIIPAFGVTITELEHYVQRGCTLVDTTCGSVLNVWKNVNHYAKDRFTSVIHGKVHHEETRATASQSLTHPGGQYLIVLNHDEVLEVCSYIRYGKGKKEFLKRFSVAASPGFDPDRDLKKIGLANQTTMLMSESLQIGDMLRKAMLDRYGEAEIDKHFRAFDTICSATQDRQDAVKSLLKNYSLDLMVVAGGYNSSNTRNLARMAAERVPTYHIADADALVSVTQIRHRPIHPDGQKHLHKSNSEEMTTDAWLPNGPIVVGLTAGASTPNNIVGQIVDTIQKFTSIKEP